MPTNVVFESIYTKACILESDANIVKYHFKFGMQLFLDSNSFSS